MSALSYQAIIHKANGAMTILPSNGKLVSKKEAQRLGSMAIGTQPLEPGDKVVKTTVVETVQTAHCN